MLVAKVKKEFSGLQDRYNTLEMEYCPLKDGTPTQLGHGKGPGHPMMTSLEQEHHNHACTNLRDEQEDQPKTLGEKNLPDNPLDRFRKEEKNNRKCIGKESELKFTFILKQ
ncbi:hypothetical protein DSO57_1008376 [Entomophthora muscae]|uniref:Uncharacterized protein n=1 Tax=Entomophthora muscae TaxID=34485 RepID=A0ACC2RYB5_9FUNG|nr:hypothetical protein DSO57_1008376 [Entomophthora muscae]